MNPLLETGYFLLRIMAIVRVALRALRRNKTRSALTALGIIIGVAAVIGVVGIGTGAKHQVEAQIASLGRNVILVFSGSITRSGVHTGWGSSGTLTVPDAEAIEREIPNVVAVSPEVRRSFQVAAGNQNWLTYVVGGAASYFQIRQWELQSGTTFTEQDVRSATKVCVLGQTVANQLFGEEDPVGRIVRIGNVPFVVLGVLTSKGLSVMGTDQDDVIIVPYTSALKRLVGGTSLRALLVQADAPENLDVVRGQIVELLRQRHKIAPGREDDFTVRTQEEITQMATSTARILSALLLAIASISLLVGGIGIMNIMLVSVTERTREIGIRMAVGARPRDILLQFLVEAVTLSSLGGVLGIGLGIGLCKLWPLLPRIFPEMPETPTLVSTFAIIIAFLFSASIGVFFGFYPARRAAQLDPIEALRYE
ncbi:MAG: ABC transporter permease [Verrucomicrobiae bacterium]|nr:ABC transporter permease [Verrucomicrobiae bacterium]